MAIKGLDGFGYGLCYSLVSDLSLYIVSRWYLILPRRGIWLLSVAKLKKKTFVSSYTLTITCVSAGLGHFN